MSIAINTRLFERAAEAIDEWQSTPRAKMIEQAMDENDLERLYNLVLDAEQTLHQLEEQV